MAEAGLITHGHKSAFTIEMIRLSSNIPLQRAVVVFLRI